MDQVVSSPRVRPYVLGQVEQRLEPATFIEPTNELKQKFPVTKEETAAEAEVVRLKAEVERLTSAQVEAQIMKPGRYVTEYPDGSKIGHEVKPGDITAAVAIEMTPELVIAEGQLIKAKVRLYKLQRERDAKAREWTNEQSGLRSAPAAKQPKTRYLGR